ncbi:hypothetical protein SLE2022_396600 [Rubroshorea leprosula]
MNMPASSSRALIASRFASTLSVASSFSKDSPAFSVWFRSLKCRSLSFSSALRSMRCSVPRWSHGVDWRSPVSLRAQARIAGPVIEKFERRMAMIASEHAFKDILTSLPKPGGGVFGKFFSLPALNDPRIDQLPYSIRILLESAI